MGRDRAAGRRTPSTDPRVVCRAAGSRRPRSRHTTRPGRMGACPPRCPTVTPRPPTGRCPHGAGGAGRRGRSGSTCTCRSARCAAATATSTPTPPRSSGDVPRRLAGDVRRGGDRRDPAGPPGARRRRPAGRHGLLRRRHADAAAARRPGARSSAAIDAEFGLAPGAEVTTESNPDSVDAGDLERAARGRLHPDLASACSRRSPHVLRDAGPHPRPAAGAAGRSRWARRGRLRAGQPRPDLRHAGGVARRLATSLDAALACAPDHVSAYALIVEDGHRAGPAGAPRRGADARRRRPGRQVPARRRARSSAPGCGWYEVSNWARDDGAAGAGTTCSTGPAATGGASAPARTPTSAACAGGTSSTPRRTPSGSPAGVSPAHAREVLDAETRRVERVLLETAAARRACRSTCSTPAGRAACPSSWPTRAAGAGAAERAGAHHRAAGCSPTPSCATCSA